MDILFGSDSDYGRWGLALIAVGMGLYLVAATLNQAALARGQAKQAAACWVTSAAAFVGFLLIPGWDDRVVQVEVGYAAGAAVLCAFLYWLYRRAE
jgi:flagellar basal body-associated protein FliL